MSGAAPGEKEDAPRGLHCRLQHSASPSAAAVSCVLFLVHFLDTLIRLEVEAQRVIPHQASSDSADNVVLPALIFEPDLADTAATLLSAHSIPT